MYSFYTSFAISILKIFFLFDTLVNGISFLNLFSDTSFLAKRNKIDLFVLILYLAALLNSLISPNTYMHTYIHTYNLRIFYIQKHFPCFVTPARTFSKMLNVSGESEPSSLSPNLSGKAFSYSQ